MVAWVQLAKLNRVPVSRPDSVLRLGNPSFEQWRDFPLPRNDRSPSAWALVEAGIPLELPDFDTYLERATRFAQQVAGIAAARQDAHVREQMGMLQMPRPAA